MMLLNPPANNCRLSSKALLLQFAPELGGVMASLFPALLQILSMLSDHRWAARVLALWEPSGTDPSAYRSPAKTAVASYLAFGDTLANLFDHRLIAYQSPFPLLLLCTLHSRKRLGGVGRRSSGGSRRLRCPASSVWFGQRQPKFPIVVVTSFLSSLVSLLLAGRSVAPKGRSGGPASNNGCQLSLTV